MLLVRKLLIFGCFRHKKRRPETSLDAYLVEPGGAAIYLCLSALFRGFQSVFVRILDLVYFTKCPVDIRESWRRVKHPGSSSRCAPTVSIGVALVANG